jgi:flagellar basal-body rod protein FlgB
MFQNLELFQTAGAMARHAGSRQAVVAQNIANADTPDFKAMEMASFRDVYTSDGMGRMNATRPNHLHGQTGVFAQAGVNVSQSEPAPNGNSVSLEDEILQSVEVSREHSQALSIYRHGMTVLRSTLGR